jgi:excisionase family DNA binding protein
VTEVITGQPAEEERLVPIPEAARRLGVSPWTIRCWVQHGKIASHKLYGKRQIPLSEVERLIASTRVQARSVEVAAA